MLRPPGTTDSMRDGVFDIEHPPQKERDRKDSNQQRGMWMIIMRYTKPRVRLPETIKGGCANLTREPSISAAKKFVR